MLGALDERHEVPDLDEVGLLFRLVVLVEAHVLSHGVEEFVAGVDHFLQEAGLMVDHEGFLRVVHDHVLGQEEELAFGLLTLAVVSPREEQKVMVQEDHPHDFDQGVSLEAGLRTVLVSG